MFDKVTLLIVLGMVASTGVVYWRGDSDGYDRCDAKHNKALNTVKEKARKSDAKRDREKPVAADRDELLNWLYQYGGE